MKNKMQATGPGTKTGLCHPATILLALLLACFSLAATGITARAGAPRESIRVVMDDNYPPYSFRGADGKLQGILVDQWALWQQKTGIRVRLDAMNWAEAQRRMEAGEFDVIDTMFENKRRLTLYDFSKPYARLDTLVFFSEELSGIRGPGDLSGFVVGAKRGGNVIEVLKAHGITNILLFDNYQDIVAAARDGRIKVFTVERPPAFYYLIRMGIQDRFRATQPLLTGEFHRAVHKGDTALLEDIQNGFNAISKREYETIDRRWNGAPIITKRNFTIAAVIAGITVSTLGLLLLWVWTLRRSVRLRTAELTASQEVIRESEERFRTIFEQASDGVIVFSPSGKILEVNEVFARMHGRARAEMRDLNIMETSAPATNDLVPEQIRRLLTGESIKAELEQLHKSGHIFITEATASLITVAGQPAILSFHRDISDRKRSEAENRKLQAQLQAAQKMESLGTLAGGIAHDMNNVLSAILGLASAHIGSQPYGSPLHHALDTICKATERGGKMVKNLLSFARQSPADARDLDINQILQEVAELLAHTTMTKIHLEMDLASDLRPIRGDASALEHAFVNLCVNAVDAMPGNGTLTLRTHNSASDRIEVVVEDTGTGMTKEVLEKALNPFFTTKEVGKGTGIGLTLVYSTVQAHRGQMEILSEPGRGTRVLMRFPACEREVESAASLTEAGSVAPKRALKALVVDDDQMIQSSLRSTLERLAHDVSLAQCGEDALVMIEAGYRPDVVILDINMPGLSGVGTLPRLRALLPAVPVILSTGRTDQTALNLVSTYSGVTLLPKPFGLRELENHLGTLGFR